MPVFSGVLETTYGLSGKNFQNAADDTLPYIYVGIAGIAAGIIAITATVATVFINVEKANLDRRQQDTQKILLDTRLSVHYQAQVALRMKHFPIGQDADKALDYYGKRKSSQESLAIEYLLNFYEFLSRGILNGNLDETTLKKSLRRILCVLVFDMRMIIVQIRSENGKSRVYENLVEIYGKWVIREQGNGEWEPGINLAPREP